MGCLLIVVALLALVGIYLAALVAAIPLPAWEALGYAAAAALVRHAAATAATAPAAAPYVALTGLLLASATGGATASLHLRRWFWDSEPAVAAYCGLNAACYAAAAVRLQVRRVSPRSATAAAGRAALHSLCTSCPALHSLHSHWSITSLPCPVRPAHPFAQPLRRPPCWARWQCGGACLRLASSSPASPS